MSVILESPVCCVCCSLHFDFCHDPPCRVNHYHAQPGDCMQQQRLMMRTARNMCDITENLSDNVLWCIAGSLPDCLEQGAMPIATEEAVLWHAHPIHVWCLVLHCWLHLHPHVCYHPCGKSYSTHLIAVAESSCHCLIWLLLMHVFSNCCLHCCMCATCFQAMHLSIASWLICNHTATTPQSTPRTHTVLPSILQCPEQPVAGNYLQHFI